ncbi:hypothetical protein BsWGS_02853 [Bradybaena similaris]
MGVLKGLTVFVWCVLLQQCQEISAGTWSMPVLVRGYASYLDVTPVKYDVLPGTSQVTFNFLAGRSSASCAAKTVYILVQHGSLPHVIQTNLTFPENFIVDDPVFKFSTDKQQHFPFIFVWPPPGPWFVIAYVEKEEKAIKQKGLSDSDDCTYYLMSSMENEIVVPSIAIDYKENHEVTIRNTATLFRFHIPKSTMSLKIQLNKCDPSPCNLTLAYLLYNQSSANTWVCNGSAQDCVMEFASPAFMYAQFLQIKNEAVNRSQKVAFSISAIECSNKPGGQCLALQEFDRIEPSRALSTIFGYVSDNEQDSYIDLHGARHIVIPFEILYPSDIGGTLSWEINDLNFAFGDVQSVQFCGTIYHNYLPNMTRDFDLCTNMSYGINQIFTMTSREQHSLYFPYPKVGVWHVVLQSTCFNGSSYEVPCPESTFLTMLLNIQPCWNGGCTDKGSCTSRFSSSDLIFYAACQCDANYQGYACTDDTNAESVSLQLAAAYLLTMSNLFFVPAIIIANKRRYFVEAFVYSFNMFFSTFYHACDGSRLNRYRLCIIDYDVLQISDFFGSACSLWITLVAMARIRYRYVTPLLDIMGPFGLLIGVVYDRHSLWIIAVPIGCGLVVIVASWGQKMYKRKKLYPTWRRYVFFLLPGLVLAAIGACVFSFAETEDNYKYVHSVWHMCIALSICLFLPPRQIKENDHQLDSHYNSTAELLTPAVNLTLTDTGDEIDDYLVMQ